MQLTVYWYNLKQSFYPILQERESNMMHRRRRRHTRAATQHILPHRLDLIDQAISSISRSLRSARFSLLAMAEACRPSFRATCCG